MSVIKILLFIAAWVCCGISWFAENRKTKILMLLIEILILITCLFV